MSDLLGGRMHAHLWREPERRRLVRLCAVLSGDRNVAEDLAQETLLEAWRNRHKLRDPAGADRWLAAIARNVCRRWRRRRGRDALLASADTHPADDVDLEVDLERAELADLLDRSLALLPPETRAVLVHRFVLDSPHAEIGARLGLSEDAVSMRLTRGKIVLRRLLGTELRREAAAYGLIAADEEWRETRVWCAQCGQRKLLARHGPDAVSFRCPGCDPEPSVPSSEFPLGNPAFARLIGNRVRPTAILARTAEWLRHYFAGGAEAELATCTRCARRVPLRRYVRDEADSSLARREGLYAACGGCGEVVSSSIGGLALSRPELAAFRRDHPRIRALPAYEADSGGRPAVVLRHQDALGTAGVEVVFARDSLRVLEVRS